MRSAGFTLLEMLLATALTALLVVGVMGVVTNITRANYAPRQAEGTVENRADAFDRDPDASLSDWADMLAEELAHAVAVELDGERGLALLTFAALRDGTRQRVYRPAVVRYRLLELGQSSWLVRQQGMLDAADNRTLQTDLVCGSVERLALTPLEPMPEPDDPEHEARLIQLGRSPDSPLFFRGLTLGEVDVEADADADGEAEDEASEPPDEPASESASDPVGDGSAGRSQGNAAFAGSLIASTPGIETAGWRLRVWSRGEREPVLDRTLEMRGGPR